MAGFILKLFGGNKSEKDVKKISPLVADINGFFTQYQTLTNDELRGKTAEFKKRIQDYLADIDVAIEERKQEAEGLSTLDISGRDLIYQDVDKMRKERDEKIEEILKEILPEA